MAETVDSSVIDKMLKILDGIDYDKPRPTTMRCHPDVIERLRASLPAHEARRKARMA